MLHMTTNPLDRIAWRRQAVNNHNIAIHNGKWLHHGINKLYFETSVFTTMNNTNHFFLIWKGQTLSPRGPVDPLGPGGPCAPSAPGGPWSPGIPSTPGFPFSPLSPTTLITSPFSPWGPGAPASPGSPCRPYKSKRTFTLCDIE